MTVRTIDQLLSEYRQAASSDRRLHIARDVAGRGAEAAAAFSTLVGDPDPRVSVTAAHHLLDFMNPEDDARERALGVIERAAASEATAEGELVWLENWRAEQQDE